jgi:HEAT repeat protein
MKRWMGATLGLALVLAGGAAGADSPKEKAQKLMKQLASHKDPQVRADAAESLGDMGAWDAVPALAAALKDPSADVRVSATYALTKLQEHSRDAVPALKEVLADPNRTVRYNAAVALSFLDAATPDELAPAVAPLLAEADPEMREHAMTMLVGMGLGEKPVRDALVGALTLGPDVVRREVALKLSRAEIELGAGAWVHDLVPTLIEGAARDPDATVRQYLVFTLRGLKPYPRSVVDALLRSLDDPSQDVAGAAAGGLNGAEPRTLPQKAVAHLLQKLKTGDQGEKVRAAHTLQSLVGYREQAIPGLAQALASDPDPRVRAQVALTLGDLRGDQGIVPLMQALKTDGDRKVRAAACAGLAEFRSFGLARAGHLDAVLAALRAAAAEHPGDVLADAAQHALEELEK